jgi:hypothetical protein
MDWFFEGLGTFLVGLLLGGTGGHLVTRILFSKRIRQTQRAGANSSQTQVGGNADVAHHHGD